MSLFGVHLCVAKFNRLEHTRRKSDKKMIIIGLIVSVITMISQVYVLSDFDNLFNLVTEFKQILLWRMIIVMLLLYVVLSHIKTMRLNDRRSG